VTLVAAALLPYYSPRLIPALRRGPDCTDLPRPLGGNNRSILAQKDSGTELDLDLSVDSTFIAVGEPLQVDVTFKNEHIGPLILYLTNREPVLSRVNPANGAPIPGLTFEITRVSDNFTLIDQISGNANITQPAIFDYDRLHLLTARSHCTQTYTISGTKLQQIGLQPGDYRIRAYYRNDAAGILPTPAFGTPTATPAYNDQGVWIGETGSGEARFSVLAPGQAPP
jgi:hypothetical protein